jgi:hypothetical protein
MEAARIEPQSRVPEFTELRLSTARLIKVTIAAHLSRGIIVDCRSFGTYLFLLALLCRAFKFIVSGCTASDLFRNLAVLILSTSARDRVRIDHGSLQKLVNAKLTDVISP